MIGTTTLAGGFGGTTLAGGFGGYSYPATTYAAPATTAYAAPATYAAVPATTAYAAPVSYAAPATTAYGGYAAPATTAYAAPQFAFQQPFLPTSQSMIAYPGFGGIAAGPFQFTADPVAGKPAAATDKPGQAAKPAAKPAASGKAPAGKMQEMHQAKKDAPGPKRKKGKKKKGCCAFESESEEKGVKRDIPGPRQRDIGGAGNFISQVPIVPYGVLGSDAGTAPQPGIAIVDPAGVYYIQNGPAGAGGLSNAIYGWLGINAAFPDDVRAAIKEPTNAKFHDYGKCTVVHVVGPDFRDGSDSGGCDRAQAIEKLAAAYMNTLEQFNESGATQLRLPPISGAIFAGPFTAQMPEITREALERGFSYLDEGTQQQVRGKSVAMCIFDPQELDGFQKAWSSSAPAPPGGYL